MKKAIYPGSFDPITNGHIDILKKALLVFDEVILLVANNPEKKNRFPIETRLKMAKKAVSKFKNVKVESTSGLMVDFARKAKTMNIIRGLRNSIDYEYESKLLEIYKKDCPKINMIFFISDDANINISSKKVHQLFIKNKDITKFVPKPVIEEYKKR